jgi:hypothetical protein
MPVIINGTTGISGTDGSAATPAVQGTDANTGMFFPAADTIAFAEGGTEVMRINATGVVNFVSPPTVGGVSVLAGPAFGAFASTATNTATATFTKVVLVSEEFDTNSCFDTGLSRFTPNVAGYYQFNGAIFGGAYVNQLVAIFKNGFEFRRGVWSSVINGPSESTVASLVYMNGTTDYVEMFWYQQSGVTVNLGTGQAYTYFNGFLARAA